MPKSLHSPVYNWVKNVYSLCVENGDNRGLLFTPLYMSTLQTTYMRVKPQTSPHFFASFTPQYYTAFFSLLPLLFSQLYPLSTVPTITKTNEK